MSLSGVRVLVTGGAGFVGSSLTKRLLSMGAVVTVLDYTQIQVVSASQINSVVVITVT